MIRATLVLVCLLIAACGDPPDAPSPATIPPEPGLAPMAEADLPFDPEGESFEQPPKETPPDIAGARHLVAADLEEALAWIAGQMESDPRGAARFLAARFLRSGEEGMECVRRLTQEPLAIPPEVLAEVVKIYELYWERALLAGPGPGVPDLPGLFRSLASLDPQGAAELASRLRPGAVRSIAEFEAGEAWGKLDVAQAFEWLAEHELEGRPESFLRGILHSWVRTDPWQAMEWSLQFHLANEDPELLLFAMEGWAGVDPRAASQWVGANPSVQALAAELALVLARGWATADVVAGQEWVEQYPEGPSRDALIAEFAFATPPAQAEQSLQWALALLGDSEASGTVTRGVIFNWASEEPAKASAWVAAAPARIRDQALAGYAFAAVESDPESGLDAALNIDSEEIRAQTVPAIAAQWRSEHFRAAHRALAERHAAYASEGDASRAALLARLLEQNDHP